MVDHLIRGHKAFLQKHVGDEREFLSRLAAEKQCPGALFVGCSDSRVVPELLTTSAPGSLFVVRNIANLIPPYEHPHASVGAALEYAVGQLHVPHLVVCGHYGCGGVGALIDGAEQLENSPSLRSWLQVARPGVEAAREGKGGAEGWWRRAIEENVIVQLENAVTYPVVRDALERGELALHGWVYDLYSLELRVCDVREGAFSRAAAILG